MHDENFDDLMECSVKNVVGMKGLGITLNHHLRQQN